MSKKIHPANAQIAQNILHEELYEKMSPVLKQGIRSIWDLAKTSSNTPEYENQSEFLVFQKFLQNIQDWSNLMVERETRRIKEEVRKMSVAKDEEIDENWFEDIVATIFISYAVIYESIKIKGSRPNIKLPIPDMQKLIQQIYIDLAEKFFKEPHLFEETPDLELKNLRNDKINIFIKQSIINVIRRAVPHSQIRKEYTGGIMNAVTTADDILSSDKEDEDEEEEEEEEEEADIEDTDSEEETRTVPILSPTKIRPNSPFSPRSPLPSSFTAPFSPIRQPKSGPWSPRVPIQQGLPTGSTGASGTALQTTHRSAVPIDAHRSAGSAVTGTSMENRPDYGAPIEKKQIGFLEESGEDTSDSD